MLPGPPGHNRGSHILKTLSTSPSWKRTQSVRLAASPTSITLPCELLQLQTIPFPGTDCTVGTYVLMFNENQGRIPTGRPFFRFPFARRTRGLSRAGSWISCESLNVFLLHSPALPNPVTTSFDLQLDLIWNAKQPENMRSREIYLLPFPFSFSPPRAPFFGPTTTSQHPKHTLHPKNISPLLLPPPQ